MATVCSGVRDRPVLRTRVLVHGPARAVAAGPSPGRPRPIADADERAVVLCMGCTATVSECPHSTAATAT
jgi:hypothetical protein